MGTLTQGQALVDIMNATGYDYVIPGNHEFDYEMPQFNHLVGGANATYLSCNFTDKRPEVPTLIPRWTCTHSKTTTTPGPCGRTKRTLATS